MTKNLRKRSTTFMATIVAIIISLVVFLPMIAACGKSEVTITGLNKTTATVQVGKEVALTATYSRELDEGETVEVIWTSDKTDVATVDANGKVKGVKAGEAKITATLGESTASCTVTVKDTFALEIDQTSVRLDLNSDQKTVTLTASATKNGAAVENATIAWKSSDPAVATVANGVVTAVSVGSATITATYEGVDATSTISVVDTSAPYALASGSSNATLAAAHDGLWYYFAKSSKGSVFGDITAQRTYDSASKTETVEFTCTSITPTQPNDNNKATELYLRYSPVWAAGTQYNLTCELTANKPGKILINGVEYIFAEEEGEGVIKVGETVEVVVNVTSSDSMPLNVTIQMYGDITDPEAENYGSWANGEGLDVKLSKISFNEGVAQIPVDDGDEGEEEVSYVAAATQYNAMNASSWYKFGDNGNSQDGALENLEQNGKLVFTEAGRMDLFKIKANPADDSSAWCNQADKVANLSGDGKPGTAFYGYEYTYDFSVETTGNFDLLLFGGKSVPAQIDGKKFRAVYLYFTDGKVEIKSVDGGADNVQATATYDGAVTAITSIKLSVTRVADKEIQIGIYVNGTKLDITGTATIKNASVANGCYVDKAEGYGQRFGIVPAANQTFTVSSVTVMRSATK